VPTAAAKERDVAKYDKEVACRRLNTTGDIRHRPVTPRWAGQLLLDLAGTPRVRRVPL
jgi:hypothetical protein